ncbi:MAG: PD-(D/E)XK nuclease family protein, partial [Firmicutes bacterium]|nr:PD-(D/E)XK nuclease family protein [Bacillota bacterium]
NDDEIMETSGEAYRDNKEMVSKGFNWEVRFIDDIHYYKPYGVQKQENTKETVAADIDADNDIAKKLSFEYPYKCYADVAASISISEIKRNYQQQMLEEKEETIKEYKKPEFTSETKGLSGAQFGTAMHAVMEHLDFRKTYTMSEVKDFVSHLANISVLTKEEAQAVNVFKIMSFIKSDLAERIRKADRIKKEVPFAMEISAFEAYGKEELKCCEESVLVHGIADCYFKEGDKAVLIDYKTDYVPEGEEEHFFDKYKIQLDIYAKAIERSTGLKVDEKYIYSFYLEKIIRY